MVAQAVCRRHLVLRRTRRVFSLVVKLQAFCRGFIVRKTLRDLASFSASPRSQPPTGVQNARQYYEGGQKSSHNRSLSEKARIQTTQKAGPFFQPRQPSSIEEAQIWHVGAIIIQTYWRSYLGRIIYLQSLCDVITVQSVVRRWLTYRWLGRGRRGPESIRRTNQPYVRPHKPTTPGSAHYSKFDSLEPKNQSLLSPEDSQLGHSPNPSPAKDQQMRSQQGHFNDPNRFGGSRSVWKKGTMPKTSRGGSKSPSNESRHSPTSHSRQNQFQNQGGPSPYTGNSKWNNSPHPATHRQTSPIQDTSLPNSGAKQAPRSKGWNADEEIDKASTRNLLMAWKQKDEANTFTIKKSQV